MDDKEKKYCIVIGLLAVVIIGMVWARWWSCDCKSNRQGYEEVRNLPVYQGNQVVNGSIGSAYRDPRNYV